MKNGEIPTKIKNMVEFQNLVCRYCMSVYKLSLPDTHIEDAAVLKDDCLAHGYNLIGFAKGQSSFNSENFFNLFENQKQFIEKVKEFYKEHAEKYSIYRNGVKVKSFEEQWLEQEQKNLQRFMNNEIEGKFFYRDQLSKYYPEGIPSKS